MVERILRRIKELGMSCSSVEKKLGFGNGAIRRFKINSPSVEKIVKLAGFLEMSLDYMLTGETTPIKELTHTQAEILTYVSLLAEREQLILLGELKERTKNLKSPRESESIEPEEKTG